ncbi:DUF1631 family protein [Litorivivens sp.]
MQDAEGHASLEAFHNHTMRWVENQISLCVGELSQKLLDMAMSETERDDALLYFKHHKYLENNRQRICQHFQQLVHNATRGEDPSIKVIPQQRPSPELQSLLNKAGSKDELYNYCLTLREEVFATLFQRAFNLLDPAQAARDTAREVFRKEFIDSLGQLYVGLLEMTASSTATHIDRRSNIEAWINHLEKKLRDTSIDASTRAMAVDRLNELRSKLDELDTMSEAARALRDRWFHPHDDLQHRQYSDEELLADVDRLFHPLTTMSGVPRSLQSLAARIRPTVESVALADRGSFMQSLHPAKQLVHQVTATVANWVSSPPSERRKMLLNVKQSIDMGVGAGTQSYRGDPALLKILHQELMDYLAYQMHRLEREEQESIEQPHKPKATINHLDKVNARLEEKMQDMSDVPPLLHKLVFSLWNRVIAKIWLEDGEDAISTQQALSLVDDIIWYLHCDDKQLRYTNTEFLGDQIERDLLNGLKLIDFNTAKGVELISSLKRLRKRLHSPENETLKASG